MNKTELFKQRVYDLVKDEYSVLGEYKNINTKLLMKHNRCDHVYEVIPNKFINSGRRCPKCNGGVRYNHDEYVSKVYNLVKDEYSVLSKYKNQKTKIKLRHNKCGHEWMINPSKFLFGRRCPKCQHRSYVKTQEEFEEEVFILTGIEFEVIGRYINNSTKIKIKHNVCGHEFSVTPYHFTDSGTRCPKCKESKMERIIMDYLNNNNIEFVHQKRFKECRNKKPLPFDFYIPKINTCIEADGIQHFKPKWGEQSLRQTKENDQIKTEFCLNNNIKLVRIPYYEIDNIESILSENMAIPSQA